MDIIDFKTAVFQAAKEKGFSDCEIYYVKSKSFQVKVFRGEILQYNNSDVCGVSFRGLANGKMGYAYSERLTTDAAALMVSEAWENAAIIHDEDEFLYDEGENYAGANGMEADLPSLDIATDKLTDMAFQMEKAAYALDKRVESVDNCIIGRAAGEVYIANTLGLERSQKTGYIIALLYARVSNGTQKKLGGELWIGRDMGKFSPDALVKTAVDKALSYLGAVQPEGYRGKVILKNEVAIDFLGSFLSSFYGENVQKGFSLLKGKIGAAIASEKVTIIDAPAHPEAIEKLIFDSEGVPVQKKTIVDKGVLNTYLYNLKSAAKDGVAPTGNGFKPSYKSPVGTACANFYIAPSGVAYQDLIGAMGQGFLITELAGLHSGINPISGDFSLLAEGYRVRDGKQAEPVEQMTIAGNFYDCLKNIVEVGADLKFDVPGAGGAVGAPSLMIDNIQISGA